jgi:sensor histidine kinase YesM
MRSADHDRSRRILPVSLPALLAIHLIVAISVTLFVGYAHPGYVAGRRVAAFFEMFVGVNCIGFPLVTMARLMPMYARRRFPLNFLLVVLTTATLTAIGAAAYAIVTPLFQLSKEQRFVPLFYNSFRIALALNLLVGVFSYFYEIQRKRLEATTLELRTKQLEESEARKAALEAQLSSLESRIHPHFLFNTLNSIAALTLEDPPLAEQIVDRLANLLRFSLYATKFETVPLGEELTIVRHYLEIERARFGERLRYTFDVPRELERAAVPPLAVQTLVENAVKFAVAARRHGGTIEIRARESDGSLRLEVWDDGPGFTTRSVVEGHGLDLLQNRLAVVYANRATLQVGRENDRTTVSLSVPLREARSVSIS